MRPSAPRLIMIASKDFPDSHSSEQLPNSTRVYTPGRLHPGIRVPMREIRLAPTRSSNGETEENAPIRVYDCSGPWGDPAFKVTVKEGLPALRRDWILNRGDVQEIEGRVVSPPADGDLSAEYSGGDVKGSQKSKLKNAPPSSV